MHTSLENPQSVLHVAVIISGSREPSRSNSISHNGGGGRIRARKRAGAFPSACCEQIIQPGQRMRVNRSRAGVAQCIRRGNAWEGQSSAGPGRFRLQRCGGMLGHSNIGNRFRVSQFGHHFRFENSTNIKSGRIGGFKVL